MAFKSRRPSAGAGRDGKKTTISVISKTHDAGVLATKTLAKRRRAASVESIESRLERKAVVADSKTFATKSLGQMTREQRHKLLYGG
jgi:hypothetical protein